MDNTTRTEETKETKTGLKIELEQPAAFNPIADTVITTTSELCKVINTIFKQTFRDFHGTALEVKFQPQISAYIVVPQLTFRVLPEAEYAKPGNYAFKTLTAQGNESNNQINRIRRVALANSTSGAKIAITDDGKSAISDFLLPNIDPEKYDWTTGYDVVPVNTDTYIRVFKLDIAKILKKIYGDVIDEKSNDRYYYQITPTFKLNANVQYKQMDIWSLNILRLNQKNLNKGLADLGYGIPTDANCLSNVVAAH